VVSVASGGTVYPGYSKGSTIEALTVNALQLSQGRT